MKIKVSKSHLGLEFTRDNLDDDVEENLNIYIDSENENIILQGEGMKVIIPPNFFDFWTRAKMLFGLKLTGPFDISAEASYLVDEVYKRVEIQNNQQNRNALDKLKVCVFSDFWTLLLRKILKHKASNNRPKKRSNC